MSVGYAIIAHEKPRQFLRLVKTIRTQSAGPIVAHLDRKSAHSFQDVAFDIKRLPNVCIISNRRVAWGDYSVVEAVLDCMEALCRGFPNVSHVQYLSGQDYPIKPVTEFEKTMAQRGGVSTMSIHRLPRKEWNNEGGGFDRVEYTYFRVERRFFRIFKRRLPSGITFYGGSAFWCLAREHCLHILAQADKWRPLFQRSFNPDEMFFHTILMNSRFSDDVLNESVTYTRFVNRSASPVQLGLGDLPELRHSRAYFGRKFDLDGDPRLLEALNPFLHNNEVAA